MATLATLVVNLTANTSDYNKNMSGVAKVTESTTKRIQSIGKVAMGVAAGGIAALGGGMVLLARKAIPAASDLTESMNAVNVVFGESSQTILEWGENAATQAGLSEAAFFQMSAQTGAMLQNLGLEQSLAADESVNLAQRAADMASIFNTDVEEALGAIQAGLRGEADPLERFGVRLSAAAVKAKAMEMGLLDATGEMDDQARATASLALLYEQTDNMAGDFVNTSGDMANAQRVAKAQMENFYASIGSIALPLLGKFFNVLSTQVMPILNTFAEYIKIVVGEGDYLNDFLGELPVWLQPIVQTIGEVISAVRDFIENVGAGMSPVNAFADVLRNLFGPEVADQFVQIVSKVRGIKDAFLDFVESAQEFLGPIVETILKFVSWKDVLIALGIAIASVIIPMIAGLIAAILPVIAVGALVIGAVALIRTAWEENWGGIQEKTAAVVEWLKGFISAALEFIQNFWAAHGEQVIQTVTMLWDAIVSIFNSTVEIVKTVVRAALQFVTEIWDKHGAQITKMVKSIWDTIVKVFQSAIKIIKNVFAAFAALLKGDWAALGEAMQNIWDALWTAIKSIFETAKRILTTAFEVLKTVLNNIWMRLKDDLLDLWKKGWEAIKNFFIETKENILKTIREFVEGIIRKFTETDWVQLGKDIIKSLGDGIGAMKDYIWSAAKRIAKAALDSIKSFLGIGSPSTVMIEIGMNTVESIEVGMLQGMPALLATQQGLIDNMIVVWDSALGEFVVVGEAVGGSVASGLATAGTIIVGEATGIIYTITDAVLLALEELDVSLDESIASLEQYWKDAASIFGGDTPFSSFIPPPPPDSRTWFGYDWYWPSPWGNEDWGLPPDDDIDSWSDTLDPPPGRFRNTSSESLSSSTIIVYGGLNLQGVEDTEGLADELMELRS